ADGASPRIYKVAVCSSGMSAAVFFPPILSLASNDEEADFYISTPRLGCDGQMQGKEIVRVTRAGATLAVVKDRRALRVVAPERMPSAPSDEPPRRHPGVIDDPTGPQRG
ncbi:MAG: hypothetical protein HY057_01715, partial [Rhodospirillales bacterium]|nr:hypothetical protein [Rhodospirillales bacterium]